MARRNKLGGRFYRWLDERLNLTPVRVALLDEPIPGSASRLSRQVWQSTFNISNSSGHDQPERCSSLPQPFTRNVEEILHPRTLPKCSAEAKSRHLLPFTMGRAIEPCPAYWLRLRAVK